MTTKKDKQLEWSSFEKGVFLVSTLGIIFDTKTRKILIGRRESDPHIEKLRWCFPGGTPPYEEDLEESLEKSIKEKTGLNVKNLGCVFSRIFEEKRSFLLMYYLCEVIDGKEKPAKDLVELKWVDPEELEGYFTTSFDPRLKEYILGLK